MSKNKFALVISLVICAVLVLALASSFIFNSGCKKLSRGEGNPAEYEPKETGEGNHAEYETKEAEEEPLVECEPPETKEGSHPEREPKVNGGSSEYNIEIEPNASRSPLVLIPDKITTILFFIGSRSSNSVIRGIKPNEDLKALAEGKPIELTVTLFSSISNADTFQQKKITYDPVAGCSDSTRFQVLPKLKAVSGNDNIGKLIFVVDANGMEIDVIQLDAIVGSPTAAALAKYSAPAKLAMQGILPEDVKVPDLILAIAPEEGGRLPIIVRPIHPDLVKLVQNALDDKARDHWKFSSGVAARDVEGLVRDAYLVLTALAEQKQKDLQKNYSAKLSNSASMLYFSDQDKATALKLISKEGAQLYWRIFCQGSARLRSTMQSILQSDLENRPLKLRIISTNLYVPWQILYSDPTLAEPIKPKLFWGFRYKLGTTQLVHAAIGRTKTAMAKPMPQDVLFGSWKGSSIPDVDDLVKTKGDDLKEYLKTKLSGEIYSCAKKSDFISLLTSQAKKLKLIFLYGHGSSGTALFIGNSLLTGKPLTIAAPSIIGPYFKFTDEADDLLTPRDFDLLSAGVPATDSNPAFFKTQPIIIMNACETGTAGMGMADNSGFIAALTRAGARSVIVTEAPVWSNFAQFFGRDLIEEILGGEDVQGALLKVRLKHLSVCKNPFGLYYSLYGNQAAYIKK